MARNICCSFTPGSGSAHLTLAFLSILVLVLIQFPVLPVKCIPVEDSLLEQIVERKFEIPRQGISGFPGKDKMVYFAGLAAFLFLIACSCVCYCKTCLGHDKGCRRKRRTRNSSSSYPHVTVTPPSPTAHHIHVLPIPITQTYPEASAPGWSSGQDCPPPYSAVVGSQQPTTSTTASQFHNYGAFQS